MHAEKYLNERTNADKLMHNFCVYRVPTVHFFQLPKKNTIRYFKPILLKTGTAIDPFIDDSNEACILSGFT